MIFHDRPTFLLTHSAAFDKVEIIVGSYRDTFLLIPANQFLLVLSSVFGELMRLTNVKRF